MKAVFRKLFKSSARDKVEVAKNNEPQQEGTSRQNAVLPSPSRKVKWWVLIEFFACFWVSAAINFHINPIIPLTEDLFLFYFSSSNNWPINLDMLLPLELYRGIASHLFTPDDKRTILVLISISRLLRTEFACNTPSCRALWTRGSNAVPA